MVRGTSLHPISKVNVVGIRKKVRACDKELRTAHCVSSSLIIDDVYDTAVEPKAPVTTIVKIAWGHGHHSGCDCFVL